MPTSYTSLLGFALPVTGELSGTWGDTVNDYITKYVDSAVAGTQTISGSQTAVTLTVTNGTTLTQVGSGSSGSAQYAVINCTGNPAGLLTITAPASSRQYLIINATSTSQSVKIVGAGPTTGVTMVTGESAIVAWNGSDYVKISSSAVDGVSTFSAGTTGFTPSTATSGAVTLAGTLATTNGGTGLTSFTANGVLYASSSSALTTGSALSFDGSKLDVSISSAGATIQSRLLNTSTSANSAAQNFIYVNGGTAGDPFLTWTVAGVTSWSAGIRNSDSDNWYLSAGGTLATTPAVTVTTSGNLGIGTSSPGQFRLRAVGTGASLSGTVNYVGIVGDGSASNKGVGFGYDTSSQTGVIYSETASAASNLAFWTYSGSAWGERLRITSGGQIAAVSAGTAAAPVITKSDDLDTGIFFPAANELGFAVNGVEELRITSAGFTRPVAYADTVSALGNTGTATTVNLLNANVFTATLTGNCTFTLSNAIATGSSSFTLVLTNDGTAGRTVAWAGGSFVFPGGAATLSRTTTANATDVWVFFTTNGGSTWYGNIAMKDVKA